MEPSNSVDPGRTRNADVAIVVAGGDPISPATVVDLPGGATVIAADSGLDRVLALGWPVDAVVGDLDSVTPSGLETAQSWGTAIHRHPADKDETDLELALGLAVELGARRVVVVGLAGDRFDHVLANALVLAAPALAGVVVEGRFGDAVVRVVRRRLEILGRPGDLVSLIPVHGPVLGIVTEGLRYPLRDETLEPGSPRGMSNELVGTSGTVSLCDGVLLAVSRLSIEPSADRAGSPPGEP